MSFPSPARQPETDRRNVEIPEDADIVAQDFGHNFVDLGYRGLGPDSPAELGLDHGRGKSVDIPEQMDGCRCCTGVSKCNMSTN